MSTKSKMFKVIIDRERCKGCELCIEFCVAKILKKSESVNSMGYFPAQVEKDGCVGCRQCYLICPDCAIKLYEDNLPK